MSAFDPPPYIGKLISAINDGAKSAQLGAVAFVFIGLFLLATSFSATDEDLLIGKSISISQLGGVTVPVVLSFGFMPAIFLALHLYTLIRFDLLMQNLRHFEAELRAHVPLQRDRDRCLQLLANTEFIQAAVQPEASLVFRWTYRFMLAVFPVTVLLLVQLGSLRLQSDVVNIVHHITILLDILLLIWFFRRQRPSGDSVLLWLLKRGRFVLPVLVLGFNFAWCRVPSAEATTVGARKQADSFSEAFQQPVDLLLCPHVGLGCRYLSVPGRNLVGKVWDNGAFVQLRAGEELDGKRRAAFDPLVLQNKRLRFANLSRAQFFNVDLTGADLRGATLRGAFLQQAQLDGAQLQGASLFLAQLQGAALNGAQLQGARLTAAQLQGASLFLAQLQGASLGEAQLQGASLFLAQLQGALLEKAELQGARLEQAQLQGASLEQAKLQGASLEQAELQGVRLNGAQLQGARLNGAQLQGARLNGAQLQGAWLNGAQLQGAWLNGAQLQGATLREAQLQGASLFRAQLQGASLDGAQLQGASLARAQLQGASLDGAQLQGASLDRAELQGANLDKAQLQGASLDRVALQGAWLYEAQLQGASLDGAQLQGALITGAQLWRLRAPYAALDDAQLRELHFQDAPPCPDRRLDGSCRTPRNWPGWVQAWADAIPAGRRREDAAQRLSVLTAPQTPDGAEAEGGAWRNHPPPQPEAVAQRLGDLACGADHAPHIARGIGRQIWNEEPRNLGTQRQILAARMLNADCPGAKDLTEILRSRLRDIAAGRR